MIDASVPITTPNPGSRSTPGTPAAGSMDELDSVNDRLRTGDDSAVADLMTILEQGTRFFLKRSAGTGLGERQILETVHRILLRAAERAQLGQFSDGPELCQWVLKAVRQSAAAHDMHVVPIRPDSPASTQRFDIDLAGLTDRDREALRRYYVLRQSPVDIGQALDLTPDYIETLLTRLRRGVMRATRSHAPLTKGATAG